jgi:hypothetical protein
LAAENVVAAVEDMVCGLLERVLLWFSDFRLSTFGGGSGSSGSGSSGSGGMPKDNHPQLGMQVLIAELLWQHTEVIGAWLDYFCRLQKAEVVVYYPEFEKNRHNYIHIWAKLYKFTLSVDGQLNPGNYDVLVLNTAPGEILERFRAVYPALKIIAVGHYATRGLLQQQMQMQIAELPVNPFFPSNPIWAMPVCKALADAVADCRMTRPASRNILLIGNSFKAVPAPLFNAIVQRLQTAAYSLTAALYGYNDISGYDFSRIECKRDVSAIDLYKYVEDCRFILFFPADYHYMNQLSGTIPLSLTFGRPLITLSNVLQPYAIESFYDLADTALMSQLEDSRRYQAAQAHLRLRLDIFFATSAAALENCMASLGFPSADSTGASASASASAAICG